MTTLVNHPSALQKAVKANGGLNSWTMTFLDGTFLEAPWNPGNFSRLNVFWYSRDAWIEARLGIQSWSFVSSFETLSFSGVKTRPAHPAGSTWKNWPGREPIHHEASFGFLTEVIFFFWHLAWRSVSCHLHWILHSCLVPSHVVMTHHFAIQRGFKSLANAHELTWWFLTLCHLNAIHRLRAWYMPWHGKIHDMVKKIKEWLWKTLEKRCVLSKIKLQVLNYGDERWEKGSACTPKKDALACNWELDFGGHVSSFVATERLFHGQRSFFAAYVMALEPSMWCHPRVKSAQNLSGPVLNRVLNCKKHRWVSQDQDLQPQFLRHGACELKGRPSVAC